MTRKTKPAKSIEIVTDSAQFSAKCPTCGATISVQATVTAFGDPPNWDFWGRKGERWQRCTGASGGYQYIHFRILFNGQFNERLAWITPVRAPAATQGTLL